MVGSWKNILKHANNLEDSPGRHFPTMKDTVLWFLDTESYPTRKHYWGFEKKMYLLKLVFLIFNFFKFRELACSSGSKGIGRKKENLKQAPYSARSLTQSSIP